MEETIKSLSIVVEKKKQLTVHVNTNCVQINTCMKKFKFNMSSLDVIISLSFQSVFR